MKNKNWYVIFYKLYESRNKSIGIGKKRIVAHHVGKGVMVDHKKQMYRWVRMAKTL